VRHRRGADREPGLIDMMSTGLAFEDLGDLTDYCSVGATDPNATLGLPDHPIVVQGDVWSLGDHRIICGDSTDPITVRRLLGPERPHLMVTDPPYGVNYSPDWRNHALAGDGGSVRAVGVVINDSNIDWSDAWRLFPGDVAYVWHSSRFCGEVLRSLESVGFDFRSHIIWNKNRFVIGRGHYHFKHECAWYIVRRGATGHWVGDHSQSTVWDIKHAVSNTGHGTQKPIECMRRPIENNSKRGDSIYEPFSGSGTTIIAAEITGRQCFAIELNPLYVYVAITRWQNHVGRSATLFETDETFAQVVARRRDVPESSSVRVVTEAQPPPEECAPIDADFDPVLAEVICDGYCPPGGTVFDTVFSETRRRVFEHLCRTYVSEPPSAAADLVIIYDTESTGSIEYLAGNRYAVAVTSGDGSYVVRDALITAGAAMHARDVYVAEDGAYLDVIVFVKGDPEKAEAEMSR